MGECNLISDSNVAGAQPKYLKTTECQVFNVGAPEWFADDGQANTLDLTHILSALGSKGIADILPGNTATAQTTYEDFQPCSSKGDCDLRLELAHATQVIMARLVRSRARTIK